MNAFTHFSTFWTCHKPLVDEMSKVLECNNIKKTTQDTKAFENKYNISTISNIPPTPKTVSELSKNLKLQHLQLQSCNYGTWVIIKKLFSVATVGTFHQRQKVFSWYVENENVQINCNVVFLILENHILKYSFQFLMFLFEGNKHFENCFHSAKTFHQFQKTIW